MLLVGRGDVVFDQDRDALERATLGRLVAVERGGDRRCVGVHLAHGAEARPASVIGLDTR